MVAPWTMYITLKGRLLDLGLFPKNINLVNNSMNKIILIFTCHHQQYPFCVIPTSQDKSSTNKMPFSTRNRLVEPEGFSPRNRTKMQVEPFFVNLLQKEDKMVNHLQVVICSLSKGNLTAPSSSMLEERDLRWHQPWLWPVGAQHHPVKVLWHTLGQFPQSRLGRLHDCPRSSKMMTTPD